ncbi:hypothetical protein GCM10010387_19330 [Streptomyces inusitatus]|uniref:DUF6879 domain-containing protein n=1 Tax=Streptomyces inusitatus TaxID=68221 RepID=A0A918UPV0_9ACTN|nr:DUF6879 family protein [Streptomyces inusitatus]GGZ25879.1 hypothetical protein GCM10010387_19330 [Streptomyces inusitatus]
MELISSAERNRLFESFESDAFHLELRDDYSVPDEDGPYASWLRGESVDNSYMEPWLAMVRQVTRRGRTVRRVRVVTEPHTPYIQWEYATTPVNVEAGERIRWISRVALSRHALPVGGNDWWLFDDKILAVGHFDEDGRVLGSELIDDPSAVAQCAHIRDALWDTAIPHSDYKP